MRQIFAATMTMGLVVLSASAQQLAKEQMKVEIPFTFHVNNITLTPGLYSVEAVNTNLTRLTNIAEKKSVLAITPLRDGSVENYQPKLIFNRYGSDYYLSRMWFGQGAAVRGFIPTPVEKELAKNNRPAQTESVNARR